ncbi:MAG: hypothetical protein MZV64_12730 [Ignavibacteriales bacterium]|nr:hypothetical protein [Ignavibacteriales bacterium]
MIPSAERRTSSRRVSPGFADERHADPRRPGRPQRRDLGKYVPAKNGLLSGVMTIVSGQPPRAGQRLADGHVDARSTSGRSSRSTLTQTKASLRSARDLLVLEGFALHDVAPVAGRVADGQEDRACPRAAAVSKASSPQGYQSTGLRACWSR